MYSFNNITCLKQYHFMQNLHVHNIHIPYEQNIIIILSWKQIQIHLLIPESFN